MINKQKRSTKILIAFVIACMMVNLFPISGQATEVVIDPENRGTEMYLNEDAEIEITRAVTKETPTPTDGVWTVFVYMCGADLETKYQNGTKDLKEMINATKNCSNLRFVVEADGTKDWQPEQMEDGKKNRMIVQNGKCTIVETAEPSNMGDPQTLVNFLKWGLKNYPSQYLMLDLWDHGGGSVSGVCFDELNRKDSLSLAELDTALAEVKDTFGYTFELIGFDACLMSTIEMANVLVPYGRYMVASQQNEPGSGWDYNAFTTGINLQAKNGSEMGKALCDIYYQNLSPTNQSRATLAVVDLSKVDAFIKSFNNYAFDIYEYICKNDDVGTIIKKAKESMNFGSNSKSEGFTNMVDIKDMIQSTKAYSQSADQVIADLSKCVVYKKNGANHTTAGGLSIYYPLSFEGGSELKYYKDVCITPYYLGIVDVCAYGCQNMGSISGYDVNQWTALNNSFWGNTNVDNMNLDYWEGDDQSVMNTDLEKTSFTFDIEPHIENKQGLIFNYQWYTFTLSKEGASNLSGITYSLYQDYTSKKTGKKYLLDCGSSLNVSWNSQTRRCESIFETGWYGLPDGQMICASPVEQGYSESYGKYVIYSAPVRVNGKDTYLSFMQSYGKYYVLGINDGVGADGIASRTVALNKGDIIVPLYPAYDAETYEFIKNLIGEEYTCTEGGPFQLTGSAPLDISDYLYSYTLTDIYGHEYYTPIVTYRVTLDSKGRRQAYFVE